jgi:coniferyl-aldehyde dehydrogenase
MNAPLESPPLGTAASLAELDRLFALQRAAFERERCPDLSTRRDRLRRLLRLVLDDEPALIAAIDADFGGRSAHETRLAELFVVASDAKRALDNLRRWMRPQQVPTPLHLLPGRAEIRRQPQGVVGIVSPWNYPLQLALVPAVGALAAGNRVLLKPSELTPRFSALLKERVSRHFSADEFAVVEGDAVVGQAFVALPWDHLFFTGSTAVGRQVARAAAENLTRVTLELGGKSPALFDADADFAAAAPRLASGKLLNAGQTCIAPDYALVPAARVNEFVTAVTVAVGRLYPTLASNPDYTSIINARHYARLLALVDDARKKGATIVSLNPAEDKLEVGGRKLAPALVVGVNDSMAIMREEIFGPLLPVEAYETLDEAIAKVNVRPRPLAFYYFGRNRARCERVLRETIAGGVTVNDTLWHFVHEELPFGGVGASGMGAYHGERSFVTFSHEKPVFHQPRVAGAKLLYPPYGATFEAVLALLRKLNG